MNSAQLLLALKADPQKTLSDQFVQNRPAMKRLIAARLDRNLKGRVDPSDVIQDTMIEAFQRLKGYLENPSIPFLKWLFFLAEQNAIEAHRKHVLTQKRSIRREEYVDKTGTKSKKEIDAFAASCQTDPGQSAQNRERMMQLRQAISMLSFPSQQVVRMRFLEGKSLAEISKELGISVDAVAKRAMRGLRRLSEFARELGLGDSRT